MHLKLLTGLFTVLSIYYFLIALTRNAGAYFLFVIMANAALTSYFLTSTIKPERLWFRAKWFGWGWTPITKEGWALLGLFIILVVPVFILSDANAHSISDMLLTAVPFFLLTLSTFIAVCYKTGEPPRWRWGKNS